MACIITSIATLKIRRDDTVIRYVKGFENQIESHTCFETFLISCTAGYTLPAAKSSSEVKVANASALAW
tara:strand:+ start:2881 stop:3087 length:207 start_codon:yes stop_codon:yes gene_type:complete